MPEPTIPWEIFYVIAKRYAHDAAGAIADGILEHYHAEWRAVPRRPGDPPTCALVLFPTDPRR